LALLEGLGGNIAGWRRNLPRLSGRFRVIAQDFRGNGRSEMPDRPVSMATFGQDTVALLDLLGIERAHLFGVSFGGFVAQLLALEHADRVGRLVLGATHSGGPEVVRSTARVPKGKPFRALYAPGFPDVHPRHVAEDLIAGAPTRQAAHARRRMGQAAAGFDVSGRLHELAAPTLVIHGTEDQIIPVENGVRLAASIPGARLHLVEGAGHVFHSERAEESDRAVIEFLEGVPA
jgi:pimeloyl-ACP methyl ester carboxylesterase